MALKHASVKQVISLQFDIYGLALEHGLNSCHWLPYQVLVSFKVGHFSGI